MSMLAKQPADYVPKMPRWKHQDDALDLMNGHKAFALFMEMRTGKTKTILDEFGEEELVGEIKQLLVVAPAGVYRTWKTDAEKHFSDDLLARTRVGIWESGPSAKQLRELAGFMAYKGPRILLVNIEALSTVDAARTLCLKYMSQASTTMVIDESTTIKNPKASRAKFCIQAGRFAKKRRILSGLPSPQSPLDVYAQFDFLEPGLLGFTRFSKFEERYAIMGQIRGPGGRIINKPIDYQNLEELKGKMAPHSFRVRLSDCYDLPAKLYMKREVELTEAQEVAYAQMLEYAVAQLGNAERVTATIVLTQMLRLHQFLCGVTKSDDGDIIDISENRSDEMMEILEGTEGKAIIWAAYDGNVRRIAERITKEYGEGSVARFWGGNADTREDEEKLFKTDPKCRFMVATAAAGGRGRTWDVADMMIYYSNTFSLEHRMQSEERNQAVGKSGTVAVYDLITHGTIEDKIVDALRDKKRLSDAITGDNWRQWL